MKWRSLNYTCSYDANSWWINITIIRTQFLDPYINYVYSQNDLWCKQPHTHDFINYDMIYWMEVIELHMQLWCWFTVILGMKPIMIFMKIKDSNAKSKMNIPDEYWLRISFWTISCNFVIILWEAHVMIEIDRDFAWSHAIHG